MGVSLLRAFPRISLGLVFLVAGFLKGADPLEFVKQVAAYDIVSGDLAMAVAYLLIPLELVLALALLAGYRTRLASTAVNLLLVFFMIVTAYGWAQGKTEGCGCFGTLTSRTPGEVLLEDLLFLALGILAWILSAKERQAPRGRGAIVAAGLVLAIVFPFTAYALPLDPLLTDLRVGQRVQDLPLQEAPLDLSQGEHMVALFDLDDERSGSTVPVLNRYQETGSAPLVTAFYGGEVDEKVVFCFNYDPNFEIVAVPRSELKRLYRKAPRFFLIQAGEVVRIWDDTPPGVEEWE